MSYKNINHYKAIKKRYQGKNKENAVNPEMPCEILLTATYNHTVMSADALRFRKVSNETKTKLLELYAKGHTPATALETIKMDIHLNENNFETLLADKKFYPDYNYSYYIYRQEFKKQYGPLEFDSSGKEFLEKQLREFNNSTGFENSSKILFHGPDYIIR